MNQEEKYLQSSECERCDELEGYIEDFESDIENLKSDIEDRNLYIEELEEQLNMICNELLDLEFNIRKRSVSLE